MNEGIGVPFTQTGTPPPPPSFTPVSPVGPVTEPLTAPTLPPMVSTTNSNVRKMLFIIPIALVVGTMIVITAILPSLKNSQTPALVVVPEPTLVPETPAPTAKPDPTKGWKVYVNRPAELSFKYPPTLSLKEEKTTLNSYALTLTDEASSSAIIAKIYSGRNLHTQDLLAVNAGIDVGSRGTETDNEVSGIIGKKGSATLRADGSTVLYVGVEKDPSAFVFLLPSGASPDTFNTLLSTVRFVSQGITAEWQTYSNTMGSYSLKYPPEWQLNTNNQTATASAQTISIRKNPMDNQFQNLVVEVTVPTDKQKIELSAGELISSLQNLAGWKETPTLDFRTIGGGQAQIISGEKDGAWTIYAVLWYRSSLIQVTWRDTLLRQEQETFDDIFGSFTFR